MADSKQLAEFTVSKDRLIDALVHVYPALPAKR